MSSKNHNYHRRKRIHHSFLVTALVIVVLSALGISMITFQVSGASSSVFSLTITNPSQVTSEPPKAIPSSGASSPLAFVQNQKPEQIPDDEGLIPQTLVTINIKLEDGSVPDGGIASNSSPQTRIPKIASDRPTLYGHVDVPNAYIFLELQYEGGEVITSSLNADSEGNWVWTVPDILFTEEYTAYITAFDPLGEIMIGEAHLQFEVVLPALPVTELSESFRESTGYREARKVLLIPPSVLEQRLVLFDIRAEIIGSERPHSIKPGDILLVKISLTNIGSPGYLVDSLVDYALYDQDGKIILAEQETVAVATQASFLKQFSTRPTIPEGDYRIEARVTYEDTQAVSSDSFTIKGDPIILLPGNAKVDVSLLLQILTAIFAVAVIIMYLEHRQVEFLRKIIHQVTEEDLKEQGLISH